MSSDSILVLKQSNFENVSSVVYEETYDLFLAHVTGVTSGVKNLVNETFTLEIFLPHSSCHAIKYAKWMINL